MHDAAHAFIAKQVAALGPFTSVLEVGSRDINGGIRDLFAGAVYEGVDIVDGPGVDYVCDASIALPQGPYDCVVCCEVFEHTPEWPTIVGNAAGVLMVGGVLLLTMAGPGRAPHSAHDGGTLLPGEFYANVEPGDLAEVLKFCGLTVIDIGCPNAGDLYASARKGGG